MEDKKYYMDENVSLGSIKSATLLGITKWAKFLSIMGFIFIGLAALSVIMAGFMITGVNEYMATNQYNYNYTYVSGNFNWVYVIIYLIILLVYLVPVIFLFQFASKVQKALTSDVTFSMLQEGFESLRKYFMIAGIFVIIGLVFFVISLIGLIIVAI